MCVCEWEWNWTGYDLVGVLKLKLFESMYGVISGEKRVREGPEDYIQPCPMYKPCLLVSTRMQECVSIIIDTIKYSSRRKEE